MIKLKSQLKHRGETKSGPSHTINTVTYFLRSSGLDGWQAPHSMALSDGNTYTPDENEETQKAQWNTKEHSRRRLIRGPTGMTSKEGN